MHSYFVSFFCFAIGVTADAAKKKACVKSISVKSKKFTLTETTKSKKVAVTVKVANKASKKFTVKTSNKKIATAKVSGSAVVVKAAKFYTSNKKATITVTTKAKNKKGKKLSAKITVTVKGLQKPEPSLILTKSLAKSKYMCYNANIEL